MKREQEGGREEGKRGALETAENKRRGQRKGEQQDGRGRGRTEKEGKRDRKMEIEMLKYNK